MSTTIPGNISQPTIPPEPLGGRVLIVDDELSTRAYLKKILATRGCEVLEAADGALALQLARAHKPDLMLLDVMMPGTGGYEVCQTMKSDPVLREIPIIMVTVRSDIADVEHAFQLGAFDYVRKPFNPRELIARVRNALLLKRSTEEVCAWKQKMSRELELAGSLQRKLFSAQPLLTEHFAVHSVFQPSMNIGGDFFDVLPLKDGGLAVYTGDVSGHGVGPAMVASMLKALLTDLIHAYAERGPAAICAELNLRFRRQVEDSEVYATLFLALFDPVHQQWRCLNCGHPAPLFFARRDTAPVLLNAQGDLPIGFTDEGAPDYTAANEMTLAAPPGSSLFFYTDGLTEACRTEGGDELGVERLGQMVAELLCDPATSSVPDCVFARVRAAGYHLETDDCTALLVTQIAPDEIKLMCSIPADHHHVAELAADCERVLLKLGWPDEPATAARLLVMEHGANTVDHGQVPPSSLIFFQLRVTGNTAGLLFRDNGREWDLDDGLASATQRGPDAPRGRGLNIIRAIANHIEVFRRGSENIAFYLLSADFNAAKK